MSEVNFAKVLRSGTLLEVARYSRPLVRTFDRKIGPHRDKAEGTLKLGFNLQRAKRNIRRSVAAVSYYEGRPAFATFTFAKQVYDVDSALTEWRSFTQRMKKKFPHVSYLRVPERHKKDGIHFHAVMFGLPATLPCMFKRVSKYKKYIHDCPKDRWCERKTRALASVWGLGFVDLQVSRHPERIGAYLAKYLTKDEPDWRMFGHHVVSKNSEMHKTLVKARTDGTLWDRSTYREGSELLSDLETHLAKATTVSDRRGAFETKWLGTCHYSVYQIPRETVWGSPPAPVPRPPPEWDNLIDERPGRVVSPPSLFDSIDGDL